MGEYRKAADYFIKAALSNSEILAREALERAVEITNPDYVRERLGEMLNQGEIDREVFEDLVSHLEVVRTSGKFKE